MKIAKLSVDFKAVIMKWLKLIITLRIALARNLRGN
jgi:hypothetical protein